MNDDAALLRRYAGDRDEEAFAELVRRHLPLVFSAALRQLGGATHRAEEVTQSVFIDLARKAESLSRRAEIAGWLYTSTHFASSKLKRTEQRRQRREQEASIMHDILSRSSPEVDWEQLRPMLDDAMHELGESDRRVLLLRFFQGRRFADVAETLGLSEDAARMRVERALGKLHSLLSRRGITSPAAALGAVLATQAVSAAPAGLTAVVCKAAFAQAATVGGAATGVLTFMTTTKSAAVVAVVLALLAVGTATQKVFSSQATAASLSSATQENAHLSAWLHSLEERVRAADEDRNQLQQSEAQRAAQAADKAQFTKAAADAQTTKGSSIAAEQLAAGQAFLARHPDVKQVLVDRSRARVDARFRPLYRALNLTSAQIEQFQSLLMEGEGVNMGTPDSNGQLILRPGKGLSRTEVENGVRDLLGDAGYQQYQEASRLIGPRGVTQQVAGALYFSETPLGAQQADQLTRIIDTAQTETSEARGGRNKYWNAVMSRAQEILSPPQLAVLTGFQQREQYESELARLKSGWQLPGWESKAKPAK